MNTNKVIQLATENHRKGNLKEAEYLYKKILKKHPNNPDVLHMLGVLFYQLRNYDLAIKYIRRALQFRPSDIATAHYNLGCALGEIGQLDEAMTHYQRALEHNPFFALAYCNLGNIYQKKGQIDEAIAHSQRALELNPSFAAAYCNLGSALGEKGQIDEAITHFLKAIELNPSFAAAYNSLGYALKEKGQIDEAITYFLKALELNPSFAAAYCNLGSALQKKGRLDEAIAYSQKAIELNPSFAEAYSDLGCSLCKKGQIDEAIDCYQKAIQINPNIADVHNGLGIALNLKGLLTEAIESYQHALTLDPVLVEACSNLGNAYKDQGNFDKAEYYYRRALLIKPDCSFCYSNLLFSMNFYSRYDAQTIISEHLEFTKKIIEPLSIHTGEYNNERVLARRLKIGYVSPDFRRHSVAYFIEPVLINHDKEHFEVFCYSNSTITDEVTRRIQEYSSQWRTIVGMSDENVADLIRNDKIDILIDLAGHTSDNRIILFALKPAPIQVSWIGYPATTGLPTVDYKIVDNFTDPPRMTEQFYTEELIRMQETFLCYLPDRRSPEIAELPALKAGFITFCSFNNFSKISPEVLSLWIKILKEIPKSRIVLKAKSFADKLTRELTAEKFIKESIDKERIELLPWISSSKKHLALYNKVDIGLDTYPYHGTTTTCEALWMGVPIITLEGNVHASRVGTSLLSNIGLINLIAKTPDEYIEIAVQLAMDMKLLQLLRESLRTMMIQSPLTDAKSFTAYLEKMYRQMWADWCKAD
jgi:protein O-GlcNAc transferase